MRKVIAKSQAKDRSTLSVGTSLSAGDYAASSSTGLVRSAAMFCGYSCPQPASSALFKDCIKIDEMIERLFLVRSFSLRQ